MYSICARTLEIHCNMTTLTAIIIVKAGRKSACSNVREEDASAREEQSKRAQTLLKCAHRYVNNREVVIALFHQYFLFLAGFAARR